MVPGVRKSITPAFLSFGDGKKQVDNFKYLGMMLHYMEGLTPAVTHLCKAARSAIFGLQKGCQKVVTHGPIQKAGPLVLHAAVLL